MGVMDVTAESLAAMFGEIFRIWMSGSGGCCWGRRPARWGTGVTVSSRGRPGSVQSTVSLGAGELRAGAEPLGRARRPGGGAKRARDKDPGLGCRRCLPGTSKWNKVEHRLFSQITMNWRGRPLTSHAVVLNSIAATATATGLTVAAELDAGRYPTGTKVSDQQMTELEERALTRHRASTAPGTTPRSRRFKVPPGPGRRPRPATPPRSPPPWTAPR